MNKTEIMDWLFKEETQKKVYTTAIIMPIMVILFGVCYMFIMFLLLILKTSTVIISITSIVLLSIISTVLFMKIILPRLKKPQNNISK